jgi:uncharacterized protein YraI
MKSILPLVAGVVALTLSCGAQAAAGFATRTINLRAGPGDYPTVSSVPGSAPLQIYGCIEGYRWCDVMWKNQRGWAPGDALQYQHEGRRVGLYDGGVVVEVPVTTFEVEPYWHEHYLHRPFYRDRDRYYRR